MSAYDYLPDSHSSSLFDIRARPGALYDYVSNLIEGEMRSHVFANATAGSDFTRCVRPGARAYYFVGKDSRSFTTNIFGEILGAKYGTFLTARYNHFPGDDKLNPLPLTDRSKPAKAVIALGRPTGATDRLGTHWHNQLVSANDLRDYERQYENEIVDKHIAAGQRPQAFAVKEFVKNTFHPNDSDVEPNCIILTGPGMYIVPPQGAQNDQKKTDSETASSIAAPLRTRMKRKRVDESATDNTNDPLVLPGVTAPMVIASTSKSPPPPVAVNGDLVYPTADQIFVGATYDPNLQLDYGGRAFNQQHARLVQPDFRDVTQKLICPWEFYDKLRPGTLVMANVSFAVYLMGDRKIYHANILSLRVLGQSDVPVEKPQRPGPGIVVASGPSAESLYSFTLPDFSSVPLTNDDHPSTSETSDSNEVGESSVPVSSSSGSESTLDESDSSGSVGSKLSAIVMNDNSQDDVDMSGPDDDGYSLVAAKNKGKQAASAGKNSKQKRRN